MLRDNRMCLCGMLAADYATLPKAMKEDVRHFFDENEHWLVAVLEQGRKSGALEFKGSPLDARARHRGLARGRDDARALLRRARALRHRRRAADRLAVSFKH